MTTAVAPHPDSSDCQKDHARRGKTLRNVLLICLASALVCLFSYGPTVRSLGYYWDDWPGVLVSNYLTHQDLSNYLASDRPVSALLWRVSTPILGANPVRAHVAAIVLRWMVALAVLAIVLGVWRERWFEAAAVCLLVAVYPGFSGHAIAWIHSQAIYVPLLLFLLSIACSIWSAWSKGLLLILVAPGLLMAAFSLFTVEYFAGLELLRPLFIFLALEGTAASFSARLRRTALLWFPFFSVFLAWAVWRLAFFHSTRAATDQVELARKLVANPLPETAFRAIHAISDLASAGLLVWTQTIAPYIFSSDTSGVWITGLFILAAAALVGLALLLQFSRDSTLLPSRDWAVQATLLGAGAMCFGGLPVWASNRYIVLGELSDRYTVPLMLGACILAVGAIVFFVPKRSHHAILLCVLVGFSAVYQYRSEQRFAADWELQKRLIRELHWRAPGLKPGTPLLMIDDSALRPKSDYAISGAVNISYGVPRAHGKLDHWVLRLPRTEPTKEIVPIQEGIRVTGEDRSTWFDGSTSNAVVFWYAPPSCLKVLSPETSGADTSPPLVRKAAAISHVNRIEPTGPNAPSNIFGEPSTHDWCYFYETADLARQNGDWQRAALLGAQARSAHLKPSDLSEWELFEEADRRATETKRDQFLSGADRRDLQSTGSGKPKNARENAK